MSPVSSHSREGANSRKLITEKLDLWAGAIKRKSTAGRGSSNKIELYGINKLRELILDLAVRGLLVPQDCNDQPVSDLIKKIAAEKARLIKDGKIKKEKPLSPIAELKKPFELPVSWMWQHLVEIFYPISVSKNKVKTSELSESGKHPVVDQGQSFIAGYVDDDNLLNVLPGPVIVFGDHTSALKYIDFNFVAGADGVKILRPMCCDEHFFFLVCKTLPVESRGYGRHYSRLIDNLFPLPPFAEQQRIVAKVDELMALCDQLEQQTDASLSAHQTLVETLLNALTSATDHEQFTSAWQRTAEHFDTLFTTEESIDQLKQIILQLAVMGKLVPQDPNDEPASDLLRRIGTEKVRFMKEEKPVVPVADGEKPFILPEGWAWSRLGELWLDSFYGPRFGKDEYVAHGGYPTIRTTDMTADGKIVLKDPPEVMVDESKLSLYGLELGDLLITRSGSIGTMAIFDLDLSAIPSAYLIRIRLTKALVSKYALMMLMSPLGKSYLGLSTTSVGVPNVNATKMSQFVFALPPLAEQHRIVTMVERFIALCDSVKEKISVARNTQIQLADAVVDQAVA